LVFSDTYTIDRNKSKISENTSDLSTTELSEATKNVYHAKNIRRKKIIEKKNVFDMELWSPAFCDDSSIFFINH
jgi:hypothetical protein